MKDILLGVITAILYVGFIITAIFAGVAIVDLIKEIGKTLKGGRSSK